MDEINTFITIALFGLSLWCGLIAFGEIRIMSISHKIRGSVRRKDVIEFTALISSLIAAGVVLFVKPGLIYSAPSTIICLELLSVPILFHLSDIQWKNLSGIKRLTRRPAPVDQ